ncbi:DUF1240 domain-containing protein [Photorhabdus asymbiotica UENP]
MTGVSESSQQSSNLKDEGYKLKSENYLVCKRISWTSPNTYVKDIKLCD